MFYLFADPFVFQGDKALRKGLVFKEREIALREAAREKGETLAEQNRYNAKINLIHKIGLEKFTSEFAPAHMADVLAATFLDSRD